jgi:predicted secreted protein
MAKINATDVSFLVNVAGTPTEISNLTNCELTVNRATIDVTTKDSGIWAEHLVGLGDWEMTGEITIDYSATYAADDVFDALIAGTELTVKYGVPGGGNVKYTGTAHYTQQGFSAGVQDKFTSKFTAKGTGAIAKATTT